MGYQLAADFIVLIHFAFIAFVLAGGLLAFKWRWLVWLHIPAVIWGSLIVMVGWICPLSPLEYWLRQLGAGEAYSDSFIDHYLTPVIYPAGFTDEMKIAMGIIVLVINVVVYTIFLVRRKRDADVKK
ncbi:MAG: DUF2784 domain-containing protein [Pseudomonadota bacterium]|nr:DUF2784 domain-containing protein [Pseudomonadota bacterium]